MRIRKGIGSGRLDSGRMAVLVFFLVMCAICRTGQLWAIQVTPQAEVRVKNLHLGLAGPPGAGKTTHGQMLSEHYHIPVISLGATLRAEILKGTLLGREAAPYVEKGELCPSQLVSQIVKKRLSEQDCTSGFILDGYPRRVEDLEIFEGILKELGIEDFRMIYLEVCTEELIERLTSRRVCDNGHQYDLRQNPPKREGICDIDGLPVYKRKDDTPEIIRRRFDIYMKETLPVLNYYREKGRLLTVNGSGFNEEVDLRLRQVLESPEKK